MSLEQKINYQLNKFPAIKKVIKRCYQRLMYTLSTKIKCEGNITRISPNDPYHEYFFGYYDKSPWDITDRYVLCIRANDTWSDVSPKEKADILLIDTHLSESDKNRVKKIAETRSWNVQQSCMLQWLGPDFSSRIIFNDYRDGKYVSVIKDIKQDNEQIIPAPVYTVSRDGKVALTLDFSRLYNLRPGYGYYNVPEKTKGIALPDAVAIWKIDLENGNVNPILSYKDFATFHPRLEMQEARAIHKVNHLMLSPNGKRCMVLYRWFIGQRKYTRLITFNTFDGSDMYVLSDDDMVSHCYWKDDEYILAFENKKNGGPGYYLMKDKSQEYFHCWPQLSNDGHPSYSPNGKLIVTDTYPNRSRMAEIKIMDGTDEKNNEVKVIARVFAPFKYDNDTRCDLHPRWNHVGNKICFDSIFEGNRQIYMVNLEGIKHKQPRITIITPTHNSFHLMDKYFESLERQTCKNFEVIIIDDSSTDDTYEKILKIKNEYNFSLRVLRNDRNYGAGIARNKGAEVASGEYLVFVDSDDYIADNLIEELCKKDEDMIFFDYYRTLGEKKIKGRTLRLYSNFLSKESVLIGCSSSVCGKAIKRSIISKHCIVFPKLERFEDWVFMTKCIVYCNTYTYIQKALYYYYTNPNSLVHSGKNDAHIYSIKAFDMLEPILSNISKEICEALYIREVLYVAAKELSNACNEKHYWMSVNILEEKYPNWKENKYIEYFTCIQKIIIFSLKQRLLLPIKFLGVFQRKIS